MVKVPEIKFTNGTKKDSRADLIKKKNKERTWCVKNRLVRGR